MSLFFFSLQLFSFLCFFLFFQWNLANPRRSPPMTICHDHVGYPSHPASSPWASHCPFSDSTPFVPSTVVPSTVVPPPFVPSDKCPTSPIHWTLVPSFTKVVHSSHFHLLLRLHLLLLSPAPGNSRVFRNSRKVFLLLPSSSTFTYPPPPLPPSLSYIAT